MPAYWKARPDACVHWSNAQVRFAICVAASSALSPSVSTDQVMATAQVAQPLLVSAGCWVAKIEE